MTEHNGKVFYTDENDKLRVFPVKKEGNGNKKHHQQTLQHYNERRTELGYVKPSWEMANANSKEDVCYVAKSSIENAGYGLRARVRIPKGYFITNYGGIQMTEQEFRASSSDYVMTTSQGHHIDAEWVKNPTTDKGRWINDPHGTNHQPNVESVELEDGSIEIVALRTLKPNEELFMNYAGDYWNNNKTG